MAATYPWRYRVRKICDLAHDVESLDDDCLLRHVAEIKAACREKTPVPRLQLQIYALATEAIRRDTGLRLRNVQLSGALGLSNRCIIEMKTGEGKTLTAVPAVAWLAVQYGGCHVVTSNPYLAERDGNNLTSIYARLGLTVGWITPDSDEASRVRAYKKDICFSTASEFGFDFLRSCLAVGPCNERILGSATSSVNETDVDSDSTIPSKEWSSMTQTRHGNHQFRAVVVDEADSVLIDEASTPLIIGTAVPATSAWMTLYRWADEAAKTLSLGPDFSLDRSRMQSYLTEPGARKVLLKSIPPHTRSISIEEILEQVERSLVANHVLVNERDYMISDDELTLVSSSTGRRLTGRKWQGGLHQAVEVKEGLEVSEETRTTARITIQEYFQMYQHVCGMTGTAKSAGREFRSFYSLKVREIPTHRPCVRRSLPTRLFSTLDEKMDAIVESIRKVRNEGRAVLIGTPSLEASQQLAVRVGEAKIPFQLLNAHQDSAESEIVSAAGTVGTVTIATNMAGRGTDIELDTSVRAAGGLHVIATEMHSSKRIDRQLAGRCARQGDPGTIEVLLSVEDELWSIVGEVAEKPSVLIRRLGIRDFRLAQSKLERTARRRRAKAYRTAKKYKQRLVDAGFDLHLEVNEPT